MSPPGRTALLGVFAAALLAALAGGAWILLHPAAVEAADESEALPTPPEPPRLSDHPDYERCLATLRTDPEGARAFADSWERRDGGDGARHCQALALLALGEAEIAANRLEALAARSTAGPAARAAVLAQATQAWMIAGRPDRAYGTATLALALAPNDSDLLVDRAVAAGNQGRWQEALTDLDRAVALDRNRADAWTFRAAALRHLDRAEAALADIERALALDADNPEALLERGILRQLRGDAAGARRDWERAILLAPDSAVADLARQNLALSEAGPARR